MMRITPLAVWAHKLSDDELFEAVFIDTSLTHCNKVALTATAAYCLCIKYLIQTKGDRRTAYKNTLDFVCLLYTSDAADDTPCVDLGGRRIIKKKKKKNAINNEQTHVQKHDQ
eukprot:TRINITY_DN56024_c0_g1_i1.p2 TRINITY_DN56024_c0_g1~~TRINITY_DN56024_c0_g1_i1.p2  ORF type:complete len:113 (+),score=18.82 TRINITY_DN56024_c0_g1_i1:221-559(+)